MKTIKILCLGCNNSFEFEHPSISAAGDIGGATLTCSHCGTDLIRAEFHLVMEPVHDQMRRNLIPVIGKEAAEAAEIHTIEYLPDEVEVNVPLSPAPPINLPRSPLADNEALAELKRKLES